MSTASETGEWAEEYARQQDGLIPNKMLEIKIMIPAARLADFYQWYGGWLRGDEKVNTPSPSPSLGPIGNPAWRDTPEDEELAAQLWEKLSVPAKRMISYLIDHQSDGKIDGDELAEIIGVPNAKYGIAGVLAWPGRYCDALGRRLPTRHDNEGYWMELEVATLFAKFVGSDDFESETEAMTTEELVEWIKFVAHRDRDYRGGGWDDIEDTWTDEQIAEQIKGAKTKLGAQSKMSKPVLAIRAERKAAAQASKKV